GGGGGGGGGQRGVIGGTPLVTRRGRRVAEDQAWPGAAEASAASATPPLVGRWLRRRETQWTFFERRRSDAADSGPTEHVFEISDSQGDAAIVADARVLTLRGVIDLVDASNGELVCSLREMLFRATPTYELRCGGKTVATIRRDRFSPLSEQIRMFRGEPEFNLITGTTDAECLMCCRRGLFWRNCYRFYEGATGRQVATAINSWYSFFFRRFTRAADYEVQVDPEADALMVFAILIAQSELTDWDESRAQAAKSPRRPAA
ncbi:unnamed protein product, partial [Prorocentrum cordatum]